MTNRGRKIATLERNGYWPFQIKKQGRNKQTSCTNRLTFSFFILLTYRLHSRLSRENVNKISPIQFFALQNLFLFYFCVFKDLTYTDGPRYMQSFYLRFRVYPIEKWPFFWNLSSNLQ